MERYIRWEVLVLAVTGVPLLAALAMEHLLGLVPCPLCLMQRVWMIACGLVAIASLLHGRALGLYPALTAVTAGIGAGFSIRHLYLQTLPEDQVPSCGPDLGYMFGNFPLSDVLAAMTRGTGDCAKVTSIVDVLIPVGALLIFLALLALCIDRLPRHAR